jgi:DNA mismatch repair protein MutL
MTKTTGALSGTTLALDAGKIIEESDAGCPDGTTIVIRDLFFNTPARMKFMKSDSVEGGRISTAIQLQALAHPDISFRFLRDEKEILSTPGIGGLQAAVYSIYGQDGGKMIPVNSKWDNYGLTGYVSKPTDSRPSRTLQTFFVNGRPVKSKLLTAALEEAYRNRIMVGKFPACVLHLTVPANTVDVNVHPAKTEVKFLNERAVFDCIHYGVLGTLNKAPDRPQVEFKPRSTPQLSNTSNPQTSQKPFFRTMTAQEFKNFSAVTADIPQPHKESAISTAMKVERELPSYAKEPISVPLTFPPVSTADNESKPDIEHQTQLHLPENDPWRIVGELYRSYIIVEQGDDAFIIDKHAAHERIIFEKLKSTQETISSQSLLTPIPCRLNPDSIALLLGNKELLAELGFELDPFGDNTALVRQIPMDISTDNVADILETLSIDLANGRRESTATVRDDLLHSVACKAAIKAGWKTDLQELNALVKIVMEREDLKHCPHGRPICVTLSKKQLEKQFKRI